MRMRTIESAYQEIKEADSNTAISKHNIRQLVINGTIPSRKAGNKYIFDLDALLQYLSNRGES